MSNTPEGTVKKNIKKWMKKVFPCSFFFMPRQSGYGVNGMPDFIYCVPTEIREDMVGMTVGIFVGVEAKTFDGEQKPLQVIAEIDIVAASGEYKLVWGSDDIKNALGSLRFYANIPN